MSLEKNIQKLESMVASLESESCNLDKAMASYSDILKLAAQTFEMLQETQQSFIKLTSDNGHLFEETVPLNGSSE